MQSFREEAAIRAGFALTAARLDAALTAGRAALDAAGVEVDERSNRSGEDRGVAPVLLCSWEHVFSRRGATGGLVVATSVTLAYTEEVLAGAGAAAIEGEAKGDVFGVGQRSLFVWRERRAFPLESLEQEGLGALVLSGLGAARARLPEPYRAAVAFEATGLWDRGRAT